ncbi:MAG: hypothetical protein VCA73_13435 [Roseibacillus sp.]
MAEFPSADGGSCAEIPHVGAFNIGGVVRVLLCAAREGTPCHLPGS